MIVLPSNTTDRYLLVSCPSASQVLLFTNKTVSTVLYKGLSWAYARRLSFAEVHAAEATDLVEQYDVQELPQLLVVTVRRDTLLHWS